MKNTKNMADRLNLPVVGKANTNTAGGLIECNRHFVNVHLSDSLVISDLLIISNPALNIDCLIGTDIISQGDFLVLNSSNKTIVSFDLTKSE